MSSQCAQKMDFNQWAVREHNITNVHSVVTVFTHRDISDNKICEYSIATLSHSSDVID